MLKHWRVLGVVVIALLAVGLYRAKTEAEAARARVEALEARERELATKVEALAAEAQRLSNPDRIEALARAQGLAPARAGQVIAPEDLDRPAEARP